MDTSRLKRFAPEARTKLLEIVSSQLENVLKNKDTIDFQKYSKTIQKLEQDIAKEGKEQLIDRVAYTWFNRFMALRYMDVNDYQPLGIRVISPLEGHTVPQILAEAQRGNIPAELKVNKAYINDLLDGKADVPNPQNEVFKQLLIASCNHLSSLFPFLFERINDYTELLLPNDVISELSVVYDFREGMTEEDCKEVEMIGWLYQFYISEKKKKIDNRGDIVQVDEIPAVTQLFTPRWIVEYMVQNTVGKLWLQNNPNSSLKEKMPYYIETESSQSDDFLKINSPEEITFLDQATGSGHILVYGFELLYQIYEEAGYNASEIPQLIIEKNLFGYEIDERAAQLASFAVLMKAREYYRRVFKKQLEPNILCYKDLRLNNEEIKEVFTDLKVEISDDLLFDLHCMQQATNLGSLIQPRAEENELQKIKTSIENELTFSDLFSKGQLTELDQALQQLIQLKQKFHCIVDNPPYMGGGKMNKELSEFVKANYPDSKADLMACFMEGGLAGLQLYGLLGMINQHSWMFLSSYEKLREKLIDNTQFDTLLHLGPRTFPEIGGEVVQNAAFTFINTPPKKQSTYIRLVDYKDSNLKSEKTLEAIQNPNCGWFYTKNQTVFLFLKESRIGYFVSSKTISVFKHSKMMSFYGEGRRGLQPRPVYLYKRFWFETKTKNIVFGYFPRKETIENTYDKSWVLYNDGGIAHNWYGTLNYIVYWKNNGEDIKQSEKSIIPNERLYFKEGLTWTKISKKIRPRFLDQGVLSGDAAPMYILKDEYEDKIYYILAFLKSKVVENLLRLISATTNLTTGNVNEIPLNEEIFEFQDIEFNSKENNQIARNYWNSHETSWDFEQNELIRLNGQDIEESIDLYTAYWSKKFKELHQNEEELNARFIEIYGLQEELTPDVPLDEITILKDELVQKELKKIATNYSSGWVLEEGKWVTSTSLSHPFPELPFDAKELVKQFISYAVGCMFGRYSLDKEGLVLANQGENLEDYIQKVDKIQNELSFVPNEDNIIPVLDGEWFEDDIVTRLRTFLRVVWGDNTLQENLRYIETTLGKDIRKYFVKDFYQDHIKRYKKRPIYWQFSSPSGAFNVLIYMHRYDKDTLNRILTGYLREYIDKLENNITNLEHISVEGADREKTKAKKGIDKTKKIIAELKAYATEVFQPLALKRIEIDLDDGVLVNYNKFGKAIKEVSGLNDKKKKASVKKFDWIDASEIR